MRVDGQSFTDTTRRHWRILQLVPRAPRKIDVAKIVARLALEGQTVTPRSVQRDLEGLSKSIDGLVCDDSGRPFGWSWAKDAPGLEVPSMNIATAIALEVVRASTHPLLPPSVVEALRPTLDRARAARAATPNALLARWPDKVRSMPSGLVRVPPRVHADVFDAVCTGLTDERRLRIGYRARGAVKDRDHEVSPLGLVERGGRLFLVGAIAPREEPSLLALQRMSRAELLEARAVVIAGFDLDAYLASGALSGRKSEALVKLLLRVTKRVADAIEESPLSTDQVVRAGADGGAEIEATVADTLELRAWALSFGAELVVLGPVTLAAEIAAMVEAMGRAYRELGG